MSSPLDAVDPEALASLNGASALVTGGAGFIGSHLSAALAEVCDVTVLDDFSVGSPAAVPDAADVIRADVRDLEALQPAVADADVVFHLAALTDVGLSTRKPVETHGRNATATVSVLDAARAHDVRVVFASSAAVYGHPDSVPVGESDPKRPRSPYGITKLAGDQYCRTYADLYDLPTVVLRYFNVYGAGPRACPGVVDAFVDRAERGEPLEIHGDGAQTRDFVHVDDVVQANLLAAVTDETGLAYNVGTGESTSVRELADLVRRRVDPAPDVVRGDPRPGDIDRSRADVSRARERLGFEPTVTLRDGLGSMIDPPSTPTH